MSVLELRQYTMVPGRRDEFARIFDREFVESQEALGMEVIGQFLDADRPDRYVWLRGFPDMERRRAALDAFYSGPVWAEHRGAANATMTEWHDVLLLTPAWGGSEFRNLTPRRPADEDGEVRPSGELVAAIVEAEPSEIGYLATQLQGKPDAIGLLGAYRTLNEPNTYPRLPIRDDANVLVLFARSTGALPALEDPSRVLRLIPTHRSRLR